MGVKCYLYFILRWIKELARKGFPRKREDIISSVQEFLTQNPRPNPFKMNRPGEGWLKVMCECVCLFTALPLIVPVSERQCKMLVQYATLFTGFLKATPGDSRKDQ
jgi:hypothetical protein